MLQENFIVLCFIEPELLPIKVSHCGNMYYDHFCSCDLDPMTFIYELHLYPLEIYCTCENELPTSNAFGSYRITACKCMHLVTGHHFRSHDQDGGHTIRSITAKNPMIPSNLVALCFIEVALWATEVVHCRYRDFQPFCSCDLDLNPMTFIYKPDSYSLEIHQMCKYELPTSRLSNAIV